jgi:hypothetical protein
VEEWRAVVEVEVEVEVDRMAAAAQIPHRRPSRSAPGTR